MSQPERRLHWDSSTRLWTAALDGEISASGDDPLAALKALAYQVLNIRSEILREVENLPLP